MLPPLATTVIGSWAFPGWYAHFIDEAGRHPERFGPEDRAEALRDATRLAVADQLEAGTDLLCDGEMGRVDFNLGFYGYLEGIEPLPPARRWGAPAHDQRDRYKAVGEIRAPRGLGTLPEYRFLKTLTDAPVKMPVPGPVHAGRLHRRRRRVPGSAGRGGSAASHRESGAAIPGSGGIGVPATGRAELRLPARRPGGVPRHHRPAPRRACRPS